MRTEKTTRLAKTTDGRRYIVISIDFKAKSGPMVLVWGDVSSFKGLSTKHTGTKRFLKEKVEIVEVPLTQSLVQDLWRQGIDAQRAAGKDISVHTTRSGNLVATVHHTPDTTGATAAVVADITAILKPFYSAAPRRDRALDSYLAKVDKIRTAPPRPRSLPFSLTDKHLDRLTADGWVQVNFSNGEFITSSYVVALSTDDVNKGHTYDTPDEQRYFDSAVQVYWRNTGCSD